MSWSILFAALAAELAIIIISLISRNLNNCLLSSVLVAQVSFGLFILFNNFRNEICFSFASFCFGLALWTFGALMLGEANSLAEVVFWGRSIYVGPILLVYFFLYFTIAFPKKTGLFSRREKILWFVPTAILLAVVPGPGILTSASITSVGPMPVFGRYYPVFAGYFLTYFILGLVNLVKKHQQSVGVEKIQIRYVFFGLFVSFLGGIYTNLLAPTLGMPNLFSLGPFFTIFLLGFTSYAIVKHRLMSIEIIIQRSSVYAFVTVLIMTVYALAVKFSEVTLQQFAGYSSLIATTAVTMLIVIAYHPLIRFFFNFTDKLFFRGRYDYQATLAKISRSIASVIRLEELTRLVVVSFVETMKVAEISFLLEDKNREHFRSVSVSLPRYKMIEIDMASPIVTWLTASKDILVRDEVEDESESLDVRSEMERLGIFVWVPIISKAELIGIIALGNKLSGDVFSAEDIGLLGTLANQVAVALDNARLYDEVVSMKDYSEEILQSMVSGVLTVNTQGRIVTINNMAEKITGRRLDEVLGRSCEEIWGPKGAITRAVLNTLQDRCYVNQEAAIASPEKGLIPVSFSSTLLRDRAGRRIGALLTIQDMTEVKELEQKVRRADKLGAMATMAAGMAHEIKNPLSSMKVLSQLMPIKYQDEEFRKKFLDIVPREINRIDRIVESLLGFARATTPTFEPADINDVLKQTIADFERQARDAEIKVVTSFGELPPIEVDHNQIGQVFSNLILNGIQAMPNGGELRVESMAGKKFDETVKDIRIKVSDTGYGISEEGLKKLFEPFFTSKHGGTGLGLTISHSIVDGHKGFIDVDSKVGKGTTFTVTLPVKQGLV